MNAGRRGTARQKDAIFGLLGAVLITVILIALVFFQEESVERVERVEFKMGTVVNIIVYDTLERAEDAIDAAMDAIDEVSLAASTYDEDAEAYRLNKRGYISSPSEHILEILNLSREFYHLTDGIFDITVKPLLDLWSYKCWPEAHLLFELPSHHAIPLGNLTITPELWDKFQREGYELTEEPLVIETDTSGWLVADRIATLPQECTSHLRNGTVQGEMRERIESTGHSLRIHAELEKVGEMRWNITDGRSRFVLETRADHIVVAVDRFGINRGDGGLNVTAQFWDLNESRQKADIASSRQLLGCDRIEMERDEIRLPRGMEITLGGIAKGYAVDRAMEALRSKGVENALINAGGDIATIGNNPERGEWRVGLENPKNRKEAVTRFGLNSGSVCTSGNYIRYFDPEAKVGHIIDPRTGFSAEGSMSATVIADDCTTADILATALFVMGPDEGIRFIENITGAEGMIIDIDRTLHRSSGMAALEG